MEPDRATWERLGDAAPMVGALLQASRAHTDSIQDAVLRATERDRDSWKQRALAAERALADARSRLMRIFDEGMPDDRLD